MITEEACDLSLVYTVGKIDARVEARIANVQCGPVNMP